MNEKLVRILMVVGLLATGACAREAATETKATDQNKPAAGETAKNDPVWLDDFAKAQQTAKEQNRLILADFTGSDWCPWCVRLHDEVFVKDEFKSYANDNLVLFIADFPRRKAVSDKVKKQNEELAGKYGIQGFPTILLLDAEGKVVGRTGYKQGGAASYVEHLKGLNKSK